MVNIDVTFIDVTFIDVTIQAVTFAGIDACFLFLSSYVYCTWGGAVIAGGGADITSHFSVIRVARATILTHDTESDIHCWN